VSKNIEGIKVATSNSKNSRIREKDKYEIGFEEPML
jgi:hypothetical protein